MSVRTWIELSAGLGIVLLCGLVFVYATLLGNVQEQLKQTMDELASTRRAIVELERNSADERQTETTAADGREAIRATPVDDHEAMAPVLLEGLRAADQIGGAQ